MKKYIYEFIGTFFLIFTVGMTVLGPNDAGAFAPLAIGSILAVMIFAGAHISGAHYNPAVSLAVYFRGKLTADRLGKYWGAQFLAAFVASYVILYFKDSSPDPMTLNIVPAFIAEFLFSFALCFIVLNVATSNKTVGNSYFGLAIGFTVLAGAYAVGTVSGAAFNPAVALAQTLVNLTVWGNLWVYLLSNLLGGAAAAFVFKAAHGNE